MEAIKDSIPYREGIRKVLPFRYLSDVEIDELMAHSQMIRYGEEEMIIHQGDINQSFYAVVEGSVKVTVEGESGESYICTIGDGEVFGEAGIFLKVKRTANVISCTDSCIFKIDRHDMLTFIKKHPRAGNQIFMIIIYSLLRKLKEVNRELAYERKSDVSQDDIDSLVSDLLGH